MLVAKWSCSSSSYLACLITDVNTVRWEICRARERWEQAGRGDEGSPKSVSTLLLAEEFWPERQTPRGRKKLVLSASGITVLWIAGEKEILEIIEWDFGQGGVL